MGLEKTLVVLLVVGELRPGWSLLTPLSLHR